MPENDVSIRFGAEIGEAAGQITQLREVLRGFTSPIQGIRQNLGELAEAFVAAFAVEKVSEFIERMAELGTQTERTAAILGISTEEVGKLSAVALSTGTSAEGMSHAMERLALNLQRAQSGTGPAAEALKSLGFQAKDLIGLPLPEVLDKISNKFAGWQDGLNKTAIAMALLGRGGAELIPILDKGSEGLDELAQMAVRSGTAMDAGTVSSLTKMHEVIVELGLSLKGIGITVVSAFSPAIDAIVGALSDLFEWINKNIKEGGIFKGLLDLLAIAAKGVASAILTIVATIEIIVQTVDLAMREIRDIMNGNLGAAKKDFEEFQKSVTTSAEQWFKRMQALWGEGASPSAAKKVAAPAMDLTGGGAVAAMKEIEGEIRVLREGLTQKKLILDQEVAQHQITQDQKFAALQGYTQKEYQEEKALLQKELQLGELTVEQKQTVLNKLKELEAKHNTDMIKLDGDAVAAQTKIWQGYLSTIQTAWDSQLRGLLAGTTSWKQAMKTIFGDLIIAAIQHFEKMGIEWAAAQLGMTTATTSGAAARAAAETAATTTTLPARAAKFTSDIMADAAVTFAGIFANMAPILGPAAAGPAAAGQATVLAELANIPKFDVGTPRIIKTGFAMVHEGERITPAQGSGPFQGGAGGDVHHHWNVSAIDGQSVARFFRNNADMINKIIGGRAQLTPG